MFKKKTVLVALLTSGVVFAVFAQNNTSPTTNGTITPPTTTTPTTAPTTTIPNGTTMTNGTTTNGTTDVTKMPSPPPVQNKVLDAMVGTWRGVSDMMGHKNRDVLKIRWGLNHQFLIMDLNSTSVSGNYPRYEGMGLIGVDSQGKAKSWWFDNWGAEAAVNGTGDFSDNMLTLTSSNAMMNETRTFEPKGNEMIMHAKGTMTWQGGQQKPFDVTTNYKKG